MPGRRPKPTKLHELNNWPGHVSKARKQRKEPQPVPDLGACPSHIKGLAASEWKRVAPELSRLGLLTVVDRAAMEAYCTAYARWREAEDLLKEDGYIIERKEGPAVNPAFSVAHRCMDQMRRLCVEFGFTPASRSRITASGEGDSDPDEDFLMGRGADRPLPRRKDLRTLMPTEATA